MEQTVTSRYDSSIITTVLTKIFYWRKSISYSTVVKCILLLVICYFLLVGLRNPSDPPPITTHTCIIQECTIQQSQKYGNLFASFPPVWSGCYGDFYLKAFDDHDTPVTVLIDVGANKAYTVAAWVSFFLPEHRINQAHLGNYIKATKGLPEPCGSCNDCQDEPLTRKNTEQKLNVQIHAFEPQPGTVTVLQDIQNWMNISGTSNSTFEVHGMAVSNQTGRISFRKCNAGNEVCSLDVSRVSANEQVEVNVTTLDDFASNNNLDKIDILKIDTEGYEPLVFRGANRLLREHRIRLFIFEYLSEGTWRNTSLRTELSILSKLNYVCYMIGKTGVIRISDCWNERFYARHCNLLCVSSRDQRLMQNIDQMRLIETDRTTCGTFSKSKFF